MRLTFLFPAFSALLAFGVWAQQAPPAPDAAPSPPATQDAAASPPDAPAADSPTPPTVTELPGVDVNAKRDAFAKSDAKLKALIDGLPCNGCDVKKKIEAKKSLTEKTVTFALKECCIPTTPPPIDEAGTVTHDVADQERHPPNLNP